MGLKSCRSSELHIVFYRHSFYISGTITYIFLETCTHDSLLSRSSLFSSLKFKMAGIDWWSFLFYYFSPSNFFIPFFWHIRACLSSCACQQKSENILPLSPGLKRFSFTLGNDFTPPCKSKISEKIQQYFSSDCEKRKKFLFIPLRFFKVLRPQFSARVEIYWNYRNKFNRIKVDQRNIKSARKAKHGKNAFVL